MKITILHRIQKKCVISDKKTSYIYVHSGPNRPNRNRTVPKVRTEVRTVRPGDPLWGKVDILCRELYLKFFTWSWGCGERYLEMETRVLLRISIQIS